MKALIQRVIQASAETYGEQLASIGKGILIFLGVEKGDTEAEANYLADKILNIRIFADEEDKMNLSVMDIKGELLAISQFTLAGDLRKGRRPSFDTAASPQRAEELYLIFVEKLKESNLRVATGRFQTMMQIHLINDGPATFILEKRP
jgi:D-tyrosyl-tRNA(Tyr) deacylase